MGKINLVKYNNFRIIMCLFIIYVVPSLLHSFVYILSALFFLSSINHVLPCIVKYCICL